MATRKKGKAKKIARRVARALLSVVAPDVASRARALCDQAQAEPHGVTALQLRVQALELLVEELTQSKR